jgi:hypothetical protein
MAAALLVSRRLGKMGDCSYANHAQSGGTIYGLGVWALSTLITASVVVPALVRGAGNALTKAGTIADRAVSALGSAGGTAAQAGSNAPSGVLESLQRTLVGTPSAQVDQGAVQDISRLIGLRLTQDDWTPQQRDQLANDVAKVANISPDEAAGALTTFNSRLTRRCSRRKTRRGKPRKPRGKPLRQPVTRPSPQCSSDCLRHCLEPASANSMRSSFPGLRDFDSGGNRSPIGYSRMKAEIKSGAGFPDYLLPDHTKTPRRLSDLQGDHSMVLVLTCGAFCRKDRQHMLAEPEAPAR